MKIRNNCYNISISQIYKRRGDCYMTVSSKVKQTLANLKGAQGTLRFYSLQERNEEAKAVYNKSLEITDKVIKDLELRIKTLEFQEPQYKSK